MGHRRCGENCDDREFGRIYVTPSHQRKSVVRKSRTENRGFVNVSEYVLFLLLYRRTGVL